MSRLIRFLILRLVELFYPRIEVDGRENLPPGPLLFVSNHPNGLLDALVLMVGLRRHVAFLAKSTFFANPVGRWLMQAFGALPVYRQRDEGLEGGGQGDRANRNEATFARCRALLRGGQREQQPAQAPAVGLGQLKRPRVGDAEGAQHTRVAAGLLGDRLQPRGVASAQPLVGRQQRRRALVLLFQRLGLRRSRPGGYQRDAVDRLGVLGL